MSQIHKYLKGYIEVDVDNVELAGYLLENLLKTQNFKVVSESLIEIYDLEKTTKEISSVFIQNGIGINSIGRKQNSLEDYFFQITDVKAVDTI